jgi:hypothetical protein
MKRTLSRQKNVQKNLQKDVNEEISRLFMAKEIQSMADRGLIRVSSEESDVPDYFRIRIKMDKIPEMEDFNHFIFPRYEDHLSFDITISRSQIDFFEKETEKINELRA